MADDRGKRAFPYALVAIVALFLAALIYLLGTPLAGWISYIETQPQPLTVIPLFLLVFIVVPLVLFFATGKRGRK